MAEYKYDQCPGPAGHIISNSNKDDICLLGHIEISPEPFVFQAKKLSQPFLTGEIVPFHHRWWRCTGVLAVCSCLFCNEEPELRMNVVPYSQLTAASWLFIPWL